MLKTKQKKDGNETLNRKFINIKLINRMQLDMGSKFPDMFSEGLGKCSKIKATFQFIDNAVPVFKPKHIVFFAALESISKELNRLENLGVISPVDYSEWSAPMMYVKKKNGKIRVFVDYSIGLNNSLKTLNYPLPCSENIFANLNERKFFWKIDLSHAYLQIEVLKITYNKYS